MYTKYVITPRPLLGGEGGGGREEGVLLQVDSGEGTAFERCSSVSVCLCVCVLYLGNAIVVLPAPNPHTQPSSFLSRLISQRRRLSQHIVPPKIPYPLILRTHFAYIILLNKIHNIDICIP